MKSENQVNPEINPRRGLKDNWKPAVNPGKGGGTSTPGRAHGHDAPPRGRRKFLGG